MQPLQVSNCWEVLGTDNQHNDYREDGELHRLSHGVEAKAQQVLVTDAQCLGRKRRDHDEQQPVQIQPDDRPGGVADVTEDAMVESPMCDDHKKADEERQVVINMPSSVADHV